MSGHWGAQKRNIPGQHNVPHQISETLEKVYIYVTQRVFHEVLDGFLHGKVFEKYTIHRLGDGCTHLVVVDKTTDDLYSINTLSSFFGTLYELARGDALCQAIAKGIVSA